MNNISVLLIDDHKDYSHLIENELRRNGIKVNDRITHREFMQSSIITLPDVILISFRNTFTRALKSLVTVKKKYPSARIVVYACIFDKQSINEIIRNNVNGLVFNVEEKPDELLNAINVVSKDKKYFNF